MKHYAKDFIEFVSHSPTAFHACEAACEALRAAGFSQLKEQEPWAIAPGGGYFLTRNRSAVVAFTVPEGGASHFQIAASHGDSPAFKLKPNAEDLAASGYPGYSDDFR